jgi:acyl dehydratase
MTDTPSNTARNTRSYTLAELPALVGQVLGASPWIQIDQPRIDAFAQATGDLQWIHVDPARAAAGPFGTTIAHGFLTLSLLPWMGEAAFAISDQRMGVNYGLNKVRFPAPVPVGSRLQGEFRLKACEPVDHGGLQPGAGLPEQADHADRALAGRRLHRPPPARAGRDRQQAPGPDDHHQEQARRRRHAGPGHDGAERPARRLHHRPVPAGHAAHPAHAEDGLAPAQRLHFIIGVTGYTFGFVVRADSPYKTFKDYIEAARKARARSTTAPPAPAPARTC